MNKIVLFLFAFWLVMGCGPKEPQFNPPYDMYSFWEIHHQTSWDSLSTAQHLVGKWKWHYIFCCGLGTRGENYVDDENLVVDFRNDGKLEVFEKNISKQVSTWYVKIEDADLYGIVADPPVLQLYGRMFFTDNGVLFNNSYRDAADNYFVRME